MSGPYDGSSGQWRDEPDHGVQHVRRQPGYGYQDPGYAEPRYEMQPYPMPHLPPQPVYVQAAPPRSNGCGTAGFVLALIGLIATLLSGGLALVITGPILLTIWALGLLLSFFGIFKAPRGLAIAGLILSLLPLLFVLAAGGLLAAFLGALT